MRRQKGSAAVYAAGAVVLIVAAGSMVAVLSVSGSAPQNRPVYRIVEPALPEVPLQKIETSGVPDSSLPPEPPTELTLKDGCVYARLVDPEGNAVKLQVEVKPANQPFDGIVSTESGWVLGAGFRNMAVALLPPCEGAKMRARAVDVHGNCSEWVDLK